MIGADVRVRAGLVERDRTRLSRWEIQERQLPAGHTHRVREMVAIAPGYGRSGRNLDRGWMEPVARRHAHLRCLDRLGCSAWLGRAAGEQHNGHRKCGD